MGSSLSGELLAPVYRTPLAAPREEDTGRGSGDFCGNLRQRAATERKRSVWESEATGTLGIKPVKGTEGPGPP